ncbi:hypothetical protein Zm00014a_029575, partial [Zea mays]
LNFFNHSLSLGVL